MRKRTLCDMSHLRVLRSLLTTSCHQHASCEPRATDLPWPTVRSTGFSCQRLESKGLHGCIVRSAAMHDGTTAFRHLHPNEAMALNTMDPVLDLGENVRLTLSAVGQIACPIQASWIFGFIAAKLDAMKQNPVFDANSQMQAYRSWILMRCRQVWPCDNDPVDDPKLRAMVQF